MARALRDINRESKTEGNLLENALLWNPEYIAALNVLAVQAPNPNANEAPTRAFFAHVKRM
jgi:hypothetical protein